MSRNRQVWPREQVAHLWANASQDSARDPSGNMYFTGPALYSYGSHFCIGYRYERADGSAFFILNADSYSNTTSKMQWAARGAIARHHDRVYVGGLRQDTFYGQAWRSRMMRDILTQAGRAYDMASERPRDSAKRRGHVHDAETRMDAAAMIAAAVLADKQSRPDDKRAARATVRTLERVNAEAGDTRDGWAARASLLVRDEMRAALADTLRGLAASVSYAENDDEKRATVRLSHATDAAAKLAKARDIAKRYGFRLPRLPDVAALVNRLKPAAQAYRLDVAQREARAGLQRAEMADRDRRGLYSAGFYHCTRYLSDFAHACDAARENGGAVPEWMAERAATLRRRNERAAVLESIGRDLDRVAGAMQSADSYAAAGHARDAAREYGRALRTLDAAAVALADLPRHPAASRLADMTPERERAAAYVADLEARIAEENAARIAAWRDGRDSRPAFPSYDMPPMLRLSADGRHIETSRGAVVPASIAPRLWRLIENARGGDAAAVSASFRGLHVGPFTLEEIRADGSAVIGCHDIPHAEMAALAARLNLEPRA